MTAERFDIEVRDLVAKTIRAELKAIGVEARSTHGLVQQMNRELATGSRAAAAGAQTAAQAAAQAAGRVGSAQAASAAAEARAAASRATASTKVKAALESEGEKATRIAAVVERAEKRKQEAASQTAAAFARASSTSGGMVGSRAQNTASTAFMRNMGGGSAPPPEPIVNPATVTTLRNVEVASVAAAKGVQSVGQMSNNARIAMLDMTHVGINMTQMLASGVNPMRALVMESGRIATAVQYSGGSIRKLLADTAAWIGITKKVSDAEKDAAAAVDAAAFMRIAAVDAQAAAAVGAAETEIELALAQQRQATTATEAAAANARLAAGNEALVAANAEAAISSNAVAVANERMALTASEAAAAEAVALAPLGAILLAVAVAAGGLIATLGVLKSEANDDSGLKHYTKSMGYTASEVKKLNAVTVGWGDTAKAVFQVGMERIASAFGLSSADIKKAWHSVMDFLASATRATIAGLYAALTGFAYTAARIIDNIKHGKVEDPLTTIIEGHKKAYNAAQSFMDDVVKQARKNAREGQDAMAKEMYDAPHQKKPRQGWDRAKELRDANAELDVQIGMLGKYGDALERAQQIEQIGRQFREHNAPLTAAEIKVLDEKIQKLQEGRRVQEAMTAAEEAANGPERKFAATQEALNKLLAEGKITAEDYTDQMFLATRAYTDALDPLAALNRELDKQGKLMSLYGRSKDVATYIQQLKEAAEAKGQSIYKRRVGPAGTNDNGDIVVTGSRGTLTDEAQGMVDQFKKQQRSGELTSKFEAIDPREQKRQESTTNFILDNYKEMYAAIDEFRQQDVANEEEASERKKNLDSALMTARLQTASELFGQLATLQNSHNRTVAAIGKAAAITQATIDGIVAVQAALKGPPGPPWSFAIAAVTGAMTAVNIAKIAGVGFQSGGYTGSGGASEPAGVVHGQEYVFDAEATRRIGVPALDAMRAGSRLNGPASSNDNGRRSGGVTVHQYPGVDVEVRERTDGEIEVIAARAVRKHAPSVVAQDMQNPNGRTSKAMSTHYGAKRNRS